MALIVGAKRTAVVPRGGRFAALPLHDLAAPVVQALLHDVGLSGGDVGQIFVSNALGAGGNPARLVALASGLGHVSGISIDAQCAGGLDASTLGIAYVDAGFADVVIAGGSESYSNRPLRAVRNPEGDAVFYTRPSFSPFPNQDPDMIDAADDVARMLGIDRAQQDAYTINSHRVALAARDILRDEIVPIAGVYDDLFTRNLSPALAQRSKILSGSISSVTTAPEADGAAFCLIVADKHRAAANFALRMAGHCSMGGDPALPALAPVPAIRRALQQASITPEDLSTIEMMEAFAVQAIACVRMCDLPADKVNLGGGALARGHPIGASGAILVCRSFYEIRRRGGPALCAIAAAGGIGSAIVFEGH